MVLDNALIEEIVQLIEPFVHDSNLRAKWVEILFAKHQLQIPTIDYEGSALDVSRRMVNGLINYGKIDNHEAIWLFLLGFLDQVPDSKKQQILTLESKIKASSSDKSVNAVDLFQTRSDISHLFISYSRENHSIAKQFAQELHELGVSIWIDNIGLKAGTPDWEQALRDAIRTSRGVLLVASPASRKSIYVRDEIAIARMYMQPIIPIWVDGEEWMDSIPLGLGHTQFLDARKNKYNQAIRDLLEVLQKDSYKLFEPKIEQVSQQPVLRNPYKGLRPFTHNDREFFFGRDLLTSELISQVKIAPRFLAIVGASGSGKSSIVMAGLLPRLEKGAIENSADWVYLMPFVPGEKPLETLAERIEQVLPEKSNSAILEDLQHKSGRGLHTLTRQIIKLQPNRRVVIYIDQFEELFTLTKDESQRQQFINLITSAVNDPENVATILLSLRADFYDRPLKYPELGALIEQHSKAMLPMTLADLYEVIQKPALEAGLELEANLVTELIFEVRDQIGGLPLLQFTLDRLYEYRQGTLLTHSAYLKMGGVRSALTQHAEQTYAKLPTEEHRQLAQVLFLRLIEPGVTEHDTTRSRVQLTDLALVDNKQTQKLLSVVSTFVNARLLVSNHEVLEVAHEALIREWQTLATWLKHAREDIVFMKRLVADAKEWEVKGRDEALVYYGRRLEDALTWAGRNVPSILEDEFIKAGSKKAKLQAILERERYERELQQERRSLRLFQRLLIVAMIFALLTSFLTYLIYQQNQATEIARQDAESQAQIALEAQETANAERNLTYAHNLALNARSIVQSDTNLALALAVEGATLINQLDQGTSEVVINTLDDILGQGVIIETGQFEYYKTFSLNPSYIVVDYLDSPDVLIQVGDRLEVTELDGEVTGAFDIREGFVGILFENIGLALNGDNLYNLEVVDLTQERPVLEINDAFAYDLMPNTNSLLLIANNQGVVVIETNDFQANHLINNPPGMSLVASIGGLGPDYFSGWIKDHYLILVYSACEESRLEHPNCAGDTISRLVNVTDGTILLEVNGIASSVNYIGDTDYFIINYRSIQYNDLDSVNPIDMGYSEIRHLSDPDFMLTINSTLQNYGNAIDLSIDQSQYFLITYTNPSGLENSEIWSVGAASPLVTVSSDIRGRVEFFESINRLVYINNETLFIHDMDSLSVEDRIDGIRSLWRWGANEYYLWVTLSGTSQEQLLNIQSLQTMSEVTQAVAGLREHNVWTINAQQELSIWTLDPLETYPINRPVNDVIQIDDTDNPEFYITNFQDNTAAVWEIDAVSPSIQLPKAVVSFRVTTTFFAILYTDGQIEARSRATWEIVSTIYNISTESRLKGFGDTLLISNSTDMSLYSLISGNRLYTFMPNTTAFISTNNEELIFQTPQEQLVVLDIGLMLELDQLPYDVNSRLRIACRHLQRIQFDPERLSPYLLDERQSCND